MDGARLNDKEAIKQMGFENSKFVDTLVQCSLRQMLENGFFHADPHAGMSVWLCASSMATTSCIERAFSIQAPNSI